MHPRPSTLNHNPIKCCNAEDKHKLKREVCLMRFEPHQPPFNECSDEVWTSSATLEFQERHSVAAVCQVGARGNDARLPRWATEMPRFQETAPP